MIGSEQLTMAAANEVAHKFKKAGVSLTRFNISQMNWGKFSTDLVDATHVLLILSARHNAPVSELHRKNVAEITNLLHLTHREVMPRMSVLFLTPFAVEEFGWLIGENHASAVFATSSLTMSKIPSSNMRMVLIEDLTYPPTADKLVEATIGKPALINAT